MNKINFALLGIISIAIIGVAFLSNPTESNNNNIAIESFVVPQINLLT